MEFCTLQIICIFVIMTSSQVKMANIKRQSGVCPTTNTQKVDCGYNGITSTQCAARGCCWSQIQEVGVPWCYHYKNNDAECTFNDADKINCGQRVNSTECSERGCCWDPVTVNRIPWCYYKATTVSAECVLDDSNKVGCGSRIMDSTSCLQLGCCWEPTLTTNVPWCFHEKNENSECVMDVAHRVNCGHYDVTECVNQGCCWSPINNVGVPWCFYGKDSCGNPKVRLSQTEKETVVRVHNELRAQEQASNMRYLRWSEELANLAQTLADRCLYEMENLAVCSGGTAGQNTFILTINESSTFSQYTLDTRIERAIRGFYSEKLSYSIETNGCGATCGHYTQVVWYDSSEVGCASNLCHPWYEYNKVHQDTRSILVVCNYLPAGNVFGGRPYIPGPHCSNCAAVVETDNAICVNNTFCEPCTSPDSECKIASYTCYNGAIFNYDSGKCDCVAGYFGQDCQYVVSANSCKNGGVYNPTKGGCDCFAGYCGEICHKSDLIPSTNCVSYANLNYCSPTSNYYAYMDINCACTCLAYLNS